MGSSLAFFHIFAIPVMVIAVMFALAVSFVAALMAPRRTCTRKRCGVWPRFCSRCGPKPLFA